MATTKVEERIPARMPTAVYERLVEAANAVGATLNQFLVQSALEKADKILENERVIRLTGKAAQRVFGLIDYPPAPNAALKGALKRRSASQCRK